MDLEKLGTAIEEKYQKKAHRISAQKSLSMPESVSTTSIENAENELLYGDKSGGLMYRSLQRWGKNQTHIFLTIFKS